MLPQRDRSTSGSQSTIPLNLLPDTQQILLAIAESQSSNPEGVPLDLLVTLLVTNLWAPAQKISG